jgi:hypothetical protein
VLSVGLFIGEEIFSVGNTEKDKSAFSAQLTTTPHSQIEVEKGKETLD